MTKSEVEAMNTRPAGFFTLLISFILSVFSCNVLGSDGVDKGCFLDEGIASWYGSDFHGLLTANGETYDMESMTAAHKTLPFNTIVRVINVDNKKSVDVRINNRGPFVPGRVIDLSRRAAGEIDIITTGLVDVEVYLIEEGESPPESPACS